MQAAERDTLIDIFDRHFIEGQEVEGQEFEGMSVIGQFRDLDNPDSLVWLRGFPDMAARRDALDHLCGRPASYMSRSGGVDADAGLVDKIHERHADNQEHDRPEDRGGLPATALQAPNPRRSSRDIDELAHVLLRNDKRG